MIFKKDNFLFGCILGLIAPLIGVLLFKYYKFQMFSFKEVFQFMYYEPGHATLSVALSLSLLLNAVLFTVYINTSKDKTAKGIFATTMFYGLIILLIKTFV
jgi:hypothetical protein